MGSAKRASGNNCVWNLNFFTFLKKRGEKQEGKEVKKKLGRGCSKQKSVHRKQREKCNSSRTRKKSKEFFILFFSYLRLVALSNTHTHTHTHALRE